jgi:excisionase family DNA binding protein
MATHPPLLTTAQVAERLGVNVRTVHRWVERGSLTPALKATGIRGPLFFAAAEVERLAQEAA